MSTHHTSDPVCPSCSEKLAQTHIDLANWFLNDVKTKFHDVHISWSYRGKEDQEQMVTDGKSALHYPDSAHNKTDEKGNPCSHALDLFQLVDGKALFSKGFYAQISWIHSSLKPPVPIFWGANWPHLGDADHFEMKL